MKPSLKKDNQKSKCLQRVGLCVLSLFLCSELIAHPQAKRQVRAEKDAVSRVKTPHLCLPFRNKSRQYLGVGILDKGRSTSLTMVEASCSYGYVHKIKDFKDEYYASDSIHYALRINHGKQYSLFAGGALGVEQHDDSRYFAKSYITFRPTISLWKRYSSILAIGSNLELGKAFTVIEKRDGVSAPMKKYEPRPEASIGINLKLN